MYRIIHKGKLLLGLFVLLLALAGIAWASTAAIRLYTAGGPASDGKPVIIIDAGHGGIDPGAIGVNKSEEKNINLEIALCLRDILSANGWEVIMTRAEDISINDPKYTKVSQVKTSDLKNRLKIFEEHPEAVAISIHQNHFTQEKYNGAQMFYGRKNPESQPLAESIQAAFRENLQPDNSRVVKRSTKDVYIIYNATIPTVLVECGFLSNWSDCTQLCDEEYRQKVAFTIFSGIVNYRNGMETENNSSGRS